MAVLLNSILSLNNSNSVLRSSNKTLEMLTEKGTEYDATIDDVSARGLADVYNYLTLSLNNISQYTSECIIHNNNLTSQQTAITDIQKLIADFSSIDSNPSKHNLNAQTDSILNSLEEILNRQDINGKYIFGGDNNGDKPINVDLQTTSNLGSKNEILYNYTNSSNVDVNLVEGIVVSDGGHVVKISNLSAAHEAIGSFIAVLNISKKNPYPGGLDATGNAIPHDENAKRNAIQKLLDASRKGLEELSCNVQVNLKVIKEAQGYNTFLTKNVKENLYGDMFHMQSNEWAKNYKNEILSCKAIMLSLSQWQSLVDWFIKL